MRLYYNQASLGTEPSVITHYLYDAGGNRVKKLTRVSGGNWESITYIDGLIEYREDNSTQLQSISHVMDDSKRIASVRDGDDFGDSTPAVKYNLDDHLGSSNVSVDSSGTLVSREEYYPFGETSFGSYSKKRYRFCSKEKDEESGLYYYGARYYSPWTCRFISVDPLASKYPFYTAYQYAGNKPINFIDLDGMEEKPVEGGGNCDNVNPQGGENKNPNSFKTPGGETATFQEKYKATVTTTEVTATLKESGTKVPLEKGVLTSFEVNGIEYNSTFEKQKDDSYKFIGYRDENKNFYDFNKQSPSTKSNTEDHLDKGMDKPLIEKNQEYDAGLKVGGRMTDIAAISSDIAAKEVYKYAEEGRDIADDLGKVGKIGKIAGIVGGVLSWVAIGYDYITKTADTNTLVDIGVAILGTAALIASFSATLMAIPAIVTIVTIVTVLAFAWGIATIMGADTKLNEATNHYGRDLIYPKK